MTNRFDIPTVPELLAHEAFLRRLSSRLLHDESDVDDVLQQTWLTALRRPPRDRRALRGWLATVARNFARRRNLVTGRRRSRERDAAAREALPSTSQIAERLETQRRLVEAVQALEEPYRSTIVLRFYEDRPPVEIARQLGVPPETVRSRLHRALSMLRARLESETPGTSWRLLLAPIAAQEAKRTSRATKASGLSIPWGALWMSTKIKIGIFGIVVLSACAWVVWTIGISGSNDPQRSMRHPRSIKVAVAEPPEARAMNRSAGASELDPRDSAVESAEAFRAEATSVASDDPCEAAALTQRLAAMKDALERGRHELADELQASIASCGDLAVPPVATALEEQDLIFERSIGLLTSIRSERSTRALIAALSIMELSDESALLLRRALVDIVGEPWLGDLESALRAAPRACGRIQSAWLLGRSVPCRESVMILTGALEQETDATVQVAIVSALQRLSQARYPIPMNRVLKMIESGHLGISSELSHVIALELPWPEAVDWLLGGFQERCQQAVSSDGGPIELPNVLLSGLGTVLQNGGAEAERAIVEFLSNLDNEGSTGHLLQRQLVLSVLGEARDGSVATPALEGLIQDDSEDPALRENAVMVLSELAERSPFARERYLGLARATLTPEATNPGIETDLRAAMNGSLPFHLTCGMPEVSAILLETYREHAESRRNVLLVVEQAIQRRSPRTTWAAHLEDPMARSTLETLLHELDLADDGGNGARLSRLHHLLRTRSD